MLRLALPLQAMDMLVSTDWLAGELGANDLVVLDASLHLPQAERDAAQEFAAAHIPGAQFLDLAALHDPTSNMPGKIPDEARLEERLSLLGVAPGSRIVLYDDSSLRSACRAWFLLQVFGFSEVAVLDGGLGKWRGENRLLETHTPEPQSADGLMLVPDRAILRDKAALLANLDSKAELVLDARDEERFQGLVEDHVHGLPGGHIPGSRNMPFSKLLRDDGTFRSPEELAALFESTGADLSQPIVTTCGSGITASVLVFALRLIGKHNVALYDGSWSEWGADSATPKQTGEAR